jgi:hypothetical protein
VRERFSDFVANFFEVYCVAIVDAATRSEIDLRVVLKELYDSLYEQGSIPTPEVVDGIGDYTVLPRQLADP